jgi:hypothetical protein
MTNKDMVPRPGPGPAPRSRREPKDGQRPDPHDVPSEDDLIHRLIDPPDSPQLKLVDKK